MSSLQFEFSDDEEAEVIESEKPKKGKKQKVDFIRKRMIGVLKFVYPRINTETVHKTSIVVVTHQKGSVNYLRVSLGAALFVNQEPFKACVVLDFKLKSNNTLDLASQKRNYNDVYICYLSAISSFNPKISDKTISSDKPCMIPKYSENLKFTKSWLSLSVDFARKSGCDYLELEDGAVIRVQKDDDSYTLGSLSMRTLLDNSLTFYEKYGFKYIKEPQFITKARTINKVNLLNLFGTENNLYKNAIIELTKLNDYSTIQETYKEMQKQNKNKKITDIQIHNFVDFVFEKLCPEYNTEKIKLLLYFNLKVGNLLLDNESICSIRSFDKLQSKNTPIYKLLSDPKYDDFSEDVLYGDIV